MIDFEKILEEKRGLQWRQMMQMGLVGIAIILVGLNVGSSVYVGAHVDHWCDYKGRRELVEVCKNFITLFYYTIFKISLFLLKQIFLNTKM